MLLRCGWCERDLEDGDSACAWCGRGAPVLALCPRCGANASLHATRCLECGWEPADAALATRLAAKGQHAEALVVLERALRTAPRSTELWLAKADALEGLGRDEEARPCLLRAFETAPESPTVIAAVQRRLHALPPELDRDDAAALPHSDLDPDLTLDRVRRLRRPPPFPPTPEQLADERWRRRNAAHWHGPSPSLAEIRGRSDAATQRTEVAEPPPEPAPIDPAARLLGDAESAAEQGRLDEARATAERAMAIDLHVLGGAERHARWGALARHSALVKRASTTRAGPASIEARRDAGALARELERSAEPAAAAAAWALARDERALARILVQPGVVATLRAELAAASSAHAEVRERLRLGRRNDALALARALAASEADGAASHVVAVLLALGIRGPRLDVVIRGERLRVALGARVSLGRRGATVPLGGLGVAPEHVALFREAGAALLSDLGTRGGTTLAGARMTAPLPIGAGLRVEVAGHVPLEVAPLDPAEPMSPLRITTIEGSFVAPLGPLALDARLLGCGPAPLAWWLDLEPSTDAAPAHVVVRVRGASVVLDGERAPGDVELLFGDALRLACDPELRVDIAPPLLSEVET